MVTAIRSRAGWLLWPLAAAAVLAHVSLGVLAVVELSRLGWLTSEPYEFTAVVAVAASAVVAVAGASRVTLSAVRGARALAQLLSSAGRSLPGPALSVAGPLGIADRIDVIANDE